MIDSSGNTIEADGDNTASEKWSYCLVRAPYQVRLKENFGPGEKVYAPESVIRGWELHRLVDRLPDEKEVSKNEGKR